MDTKARRIPNQLKPVSLALLPALLRPRHIVEGLSKLSRLRSIDACYHSLWTMTPGDERILVAWAAEREPYRVAISYDTKAVEMDRRAEKQRRRMLSVERRAA